MYNFMNSLDVLHVFQDCVIAPISGCKCSIPCKRPLIWLNNIEIWNLRHRVDKVGIFLCISMFFSIASLPPYWGTNVPISYKWPLAWLNTIEIRKLRPKIARNIKYCEFVQCFACFFMIVLLPLFWGANAPISFKRPQIWLNNIEIRNLRPWIDKVHLVA